MKVRSRVRAGIDNPDLTLRGGGTLPTAGIPKGGTNIDNPDLTPR